MNVKCVGKQIQKLDYSLPIILFNKSPFLSILSPLEKGAKSEGGRVVGLSQLIHVNEIGDIKFSKINQISLKSIKDSAELCKKMGHFQENR